MGHFTLERYIKDPDAYIAEQVKLHGPIFQTNYFGRKTVIVGGPETWRRREVTLAVTSFREEGREKN